jgi:hypothetical protein
MAAEVEHEESEECFGGLESERDTGEQPGFRC